MVGKRAPTGDCEGLVDEGSWESFDKGSLLEGLLGLVDLIVFEALRGGGDGGDGVGLADDFLLGAPLRTWSTNRMMGPVLLERRARTIAREMKLTEMSEMGLAESTREVWNCDETSSKVIIQGLGGSREEIVDGQ